MVLPLVSFYDGSIGELAAAAPKDWFFVFVTAIVAGLISLLVYYYGLRSTKASIATLCELAYPFAATIVNWKVLGVAAPARFTTVPSIAPITAVRPNCGTCLSLL